MTSTPSALEVSNIVNLEDFKRDSDQELIDDIGARAFIFIRDAAHEQGLEIKDVIVEHILGLSLVVGAVEGTEEAQKMLSAIGEKIASV